MIRKLKIFLTNYHYSQFLYKKIKLHNKEGFTNYDLVFPKKRPHGLSAMMRIKNEETWISYAIESIIDYVDEIVIVLQNSTDRTEEIIEKYESNKIKLYHYPFDTFPAEDFYNKYPLNSVYNLAYYYNYALSKTSFSYVWKWDGDHCAIDERVKELRNVIDTNKYDIIHYLGYDMWGEDLKYLCKDPYTSNEPSIFKFTKKTFYITGFRCEAFSYPIYKTFLKRSKIYNIEKPVFLHFKYTTQSIGKGWKDNWKEDSYFLSIISRKSKGKEYDDIFPSLLKKKK